MLIPLHPILCNLQLSHTTFLNLGFLSYEGLRMTSISTAMFSLVAVP